MHVNPDTPEAHNMRGWYESKGKNLSFQNHSASGGGGLPLQSASLNREEMKTLQEIREPDFGSHDTPENFTARATIITIKQDNIAYPACKSERCNKKVTESGNGWYCEKCNQTWDEPEYRWAPYQIRTRKCSWIHLATFLECRSLTILLKLGSKPSTKLEWKSSG